MGAEALSYAAVAHRELYERAIAETGVDRNDVLVVRITESGTEVDTVDYDVNSWPVRTRRVSPTAFSSTGQSSSCGENHGTDT
jgi:hypothetical protein